MRQSVALWHCGIGVSTKSLFQAQADAAFNRCSCVATVEPHVTTVDQHVATVEPHVTTVEPHVTTVEPHVTTMEPRVTSVEPRVTTMEPRVTTMKPQVTTVELCDVRGAVRDVSAGVLVDLYGALCSNRLVWSCLLIYMI